VVSNSAPPATTVPPTDYWSFDTAEMTGSIALDSVGGNNGTVSNATSVPGESGQALAFNGVNSSVTVNDTNITQLNASLTLAAWIRTTNATRIETIISKYDTSGSETGYLWKTLASGTMGLRLGSDVISGNREFADTTKINDGLWHHVVVVITMGQTIQFYVDGVLSSTAPALTQPGWSVIPFEMGSMAFAYYAYPFTGTIDEVKFFKRALSSSDVASVYAGM
jgi:sialidase-1